MTDHMKDKMRNFESGAIRDMDSSKLQFSRCLSPIVLIRFVEFLRGHNKTAGGKRREDNWKKGFTRESYIESKFRHFVESWLIQDGLKEYTDIELMDGTDLEELIVSLCAELFNTQGFLHMLLLEQRKRKKDNPLEQRKRKKDNPLPEVNAGHLNIVNCCGDADFIKKGLKSVDLDECLKATLRQKGRIAARKKQSIKAKRKPKENSENVHNALKGIPLRMHSIGTRKLKLHYKVRGEVLTFCGLGDSQKVRTTTNKKRIYISSNSCCACLKRLAVLTRAISSEKADKMLAGKKLVHYYPLLRQRRDKSAICGLKKGPHSRWNYTISKHDVTCETCKKIIKNWKQ